MTSHNGPGAPATAKQAISAAQAPSSERRVATFDEKEPVIGRPPDPRFPLEVMRRMAITLTALPLALWIVFAIPRAIEITGAAKGSGGQGGDGLFVGMMLAGISVAVSLLAVVVTTFAHTEVAERIRIEREETEALKQPMFDAEAIAVAAAQERNRAYGATDALVGTYADQLQAIEDHYWERFYVRHAENPEIYGTWDDKRTIQLRFKESFDSLFNTPGMLTPKQLGELIKANRSERATFRDTRVMTDA